MFSSDVIVHNIYQDRHRGHVSQFLPVRSQSLLVILAYMCFVYYCLHLYLHDLMHRHIWETTWLVPKWALSSIRACRQMQGNRVTRTTLKVLKPHVRSETSKCYSQSQRRKLNILFSLPFLHSKFHVSSLFALVWVGFMSIE